MHTATWQQEHDLHLGTTTAGSSRAQRYAEYIFLYVLNVSGQRTTHEKSFVGIDALMLWRTAVVAANVQPQNHGRW